MVILRAVVISYLGLIAGAVVAQSAWPGAGLGERFHGRGVIGVGGQEGGSQGGFVFGDAAFGLTMGRVGAGEVELGLGMLGVVGRRHETYATLSYRDRRGGLWSAGLPRPAYDCVAPGAVLHLLPHLAVDTIGLTHSRATYGAMTLGGYLPVGAAWRRDDGDTIRAVSLHYLPSGGETVIGAGLGLRRGAWRVEAAAERVAGGVATGVNGKLRVALQQGRAELSAAWFHAPVNGSDGMAELSVVWQVAARVRLSGFHDQAFGSAMPDRTGVAGEFDLGSGMVASVAAVRSGGTDVLGAWLGRRFLGDGETRHRDGKRRGSGQGRLLVRAAMTSRPSVRV